MSGESVRKRFDLTKPYHFLALGFGSGLIRPAPGTWGTLAAVPLYLLMANFLPWYAYIAVTVVVCIFGITICHRCTQDIGVHDHSAIVWDEFAGFFITMILVPPTLLNLVLGFALFRFFDIVKPWPISYLDAKVPGGAGIMLDDIVAGLFSLIILHVVLTLL